jgi:hypothetical protein
MLAVEVNFPFTIMKYHNVLLTCYLNLHLIRGTLNIAGFAQMSRFTVTYPPEMLPDAFDPETAEVVVLEAGPNEALLATIFTAHSPQFTRQLPRRSWLH